MGLMAVAQYWLGDGEKGPLSLLGSLNNLTRSTRKDYFDWLLKLPEEVHFN